MLVRRVVVVCAALVALASARAGNYIWEWGGAQGGFTILQAEQTVWITAAGTYKFAATSDDPNNPSYYRFG